jgi:hypothetical protein
VLFEKLTVAQLVSRHSPAFYGTRRFITVFTRARHWSLFWVRWSVHAVISCSSNALPHISQSILMSKNLFYKSTCYWAWLFILLNTESLYWYVDHMASWPRRQRPTLSLDSSVTLHGPKTHFLARLKDSRTTVFDPTSSEILNGCL